MRSSRILAAVLALAAATGTAEAAGPDAADRKLDRALRELVRGPGGPPGAIAVVKRPGDRRVHTAGFADLDGRHLRAGDHMRIASVSKAFSGAVALTLVADGILSLDDTIGERLPDLPAAWHGITLRQLLSHTSGLPDFTASREFGAALSGSPERAPPPRDLLAFVADEPLNFPPGSDYEYSNSDNIAVALIVEAVTGTGYADAVRSTVRSPLGLGRTLIPTGVLIPRPFLRGYDASEPGTPEDVSQVVAFGGWAWASGGIVSTPANLSRFVRAYVGGELFGGAARREQFTFIDGARSDPPGPGRNAGGLALFRYRSRCGTVFGHTGSILGYTQLIAATRNGRRSLTFSITTQAPDELIPELRRAQARAVCAALAR